MSVWLVAGVPAVAHAQVPDFEPVTAAELIDPAPGDWINWRRTLNGQGFSPLDQINRDTVAHLRLVWSWSMQPGTDQVTPLVRDGVMFVPSRSGIRALDAATGDLLWAHTRRRAEPEDADLPRRNGGSVANRHRSGRRARSHARTSAAAAR